MRAEVDGDLRPPRSPLVDAVRRAGHIIEDGAPGELFTNPREQRTRDFLQAVL